MGDSEGEGRGREGTDYNRWDMEKRSGGLTLAALVRVLGLLGMGLYLTGCATLGTDSRGTEITLTSHPLNAFVVVDEIPVGNTPVKLRVDGRIDHFAMFELDGYQPKGVVLRKKFNNTTLINVFVPALVNGGREMISSNPDNPSAGSRFFIGALVGAAYGSLGIIWDWISGHIWTVQSEVVDVLLGQVPVSETTRANPIPSRRHVLAVFDLEPKNVKKGEASLVSDMVRDAFFNAGTFTLVEKGQMEKVLAEQVFQQTGCTSQECSVKLGRILNANYVMLGSLGMMTGTYILAIRIVDVETNAVVMADSARGKDFDALFEDGLKMKDRLHEKLSMFREKPVPGSMLVPKAQAEGR